MGLQSFTEKWQRIDFIGLAEKVLDDISEEIAQFNIDQMWDGKRGDGSEIQPEYADATIWFKWQKNQPVDRVTLKDTGDFHKSIFATVQFDTLILDADDTKTFDLVDKYGTEILGLTTESLKELQKIFRPRYVEEIIKALI